MYTGGFVSKETIDKVLSGIKENKLSNIEAYHLMQQDRDLSEILYFKGDKVKIDKDAYKRIIESIHSELNKK